MSEPTDDQLDGLFRKSAEEFDPPFDPVAWRDMKTRLDANDRTATGGLIWKKLLRWGLPALLLLMTGVAWYAYRGVSPAVNKSVSQMITKPTPILSQQAQQEKITKITAEHKSTGPENKSTRTDMVDSKELAAGESPTDSLVAVANPTASENSFTKPETNSGGKAISGSTRTTKRLESAYGVIKVKSDQLKSSRLTKLKTTVDRNVSGSTPYQLLKTSRQTGRINRKQRNGSINQLSTTWPTTTAYATTSNMPFSKRGSSGGQESKSVQTAVGYVNDLSPVSSKPAPVALPSVTELKTRSGKWAGLSPSLNRDVVLQPDTMARSVVPKLPSERGLSIRAVVAPDLSSIGLKNFSRPGTNIGVLLEYRLASRWSVQAGVIQSTKVYRAKASEYDFPWMWPVDPSSIDGRCTMLDIPLNVRYDFALKPRLDGKLPSRWFVSGGVTSYIIKQEDYYYNYPPHTYPKNTELNASTGGYGFSQLNISVGYERALSKRLSWQVEPFMKAPLRGVGFFKVNLLSTGAFFSIRYKLF